NWIDLLRAHAGLLQYRAIETAQIEIGLAISMLDAELGDFSPSFDQGTRNVLLNLVAARTDRRSQGRFDPAGRNTVLAVQKLNHLWRYYRQGSTPAGMSQRHD